MNNPQRLLDAKKELETALAYISERQAVPLANIRLCMEHIRGASCKLHALECSLMGIPEPRVGE